MISLVQDVRQAAPRTSGGRPSALVRDMLRAWIAHHQRLLDLGVTRYL